MKGAKELADTLREFCVIESQDDGVAIIAHLDAKAAIDSAELGEVETIKSRFDGGMAGENILQTVRDIGTLLAIVQRQAGEMIEKRRAHDATARHLEEACSMILKLRAEATEQRERAAESELNARGQKGLADLAMQVVATRTQELMVAEERARVLANGVAAYRVGGYTAAQVWENGEGKSVPR